MATIHFILQGKGGVGKSLISALMMQYHLKSEIPTIAIDTDPVNASLAAYQTFKAKRIELLDEFQNLQPRRFDDLMDLIFKHDGNDFIIDNGASSFIPLCSYLVENDVFNMLQQINRKVVVHTVVTGGQAMMDTLNGLAALGKNMNVPIVVWLNEYFGEIKAEGKDFEQLKVYEVLKDRVVNIIRINKMSPLFEDDFRNILEKHITFDDAIVDSRIGLMSRNRLKILQNNINGQLEKLRESLENLEQTDHES